VTDGFFELGVFEFSSAFVLARSSPFSLQCVWSFCCFLQVQGVGHIVGVFVPVLLVVECACVSFCSVVSFGWSVGTGVQEVEGGV
jgi:hypothetical protein